MLYSNTASFLIIQRIGSGREILLVILIAMLSRQLFSFALIGGEVSSYLVFKENLFR